VNLGEGHRRFAAGERIHTENSYKYAEQEFERLLRDAGFPMVRSWSSPDRGYFVFYATLT
jgi:L-histidine Nalpha-methyltransferase